MHSCSLIGKIRKRGSDVWLLRWSDISISEKRIYRKRVIGTLKEYPDSESPRRAVASLITGSIALILELVSARRPCLNFPTTISS